MTKSQPTSTVNIDIDDRRKRALEEYMSVLHSDYTPIGEDDDPSVVNVISGNSGNEYYVDLREGGCTCHDYKYRQNECKHVRRAKIALGNRPLFQKEKEVLDVDPDLGANAPGPVVIDKSNIS